MDMTAQLMRTALKSLNRRLKKPVHLIVGGGGAMLLAHHFSLSTKDIDAVPAKGVTMDELDPYIKEVAKELELAPDWLNPYYSTFAHVLPTDYGSRLVEIFSLKWLKVSALSKEDLLIMKCFAARQKDVVHARALFRKGTRLDIVKKQFEYLKARRIPGCDKASNFLTEIEAFFSERGE